MPDFDAYYGNDDVRALQRAQDIQVDVLRETAGAVIHARTFSSDDPAQLGWDALRDRLAKEGRVTLRGAGRETLTEGLEELGGDTLSQHHWDLFMAESNALEAACRPLVQASLPEGLRRVDAAELDDHMLHRAQAFMAAQGLSPFSKDALAGRLFPGQMVILVDEKGVVAATGFAAMTHNRFSPFHGVAWVGLIAVAPALRGQAMGKYVDALSNLVAIDQLGAIGTMEFVAQDNTPSRRMLEACGLRQVPEVSVTMFSKTDNRLTR